MQNHLSLKYAGFASHVLGGAKNAVSLLGQQALATYDLSIQRRHCSSSVNTPTTTPPPTPSTTHMSGSTTATTYGARAAELQKKIPDPPQESELDPFRVGYNMGMLSVQLESIRMKMEDNKEVSKTHFASMRETNRNNHETVTRTLSDNRGIVLQQLQDNLDKLSQKMDTHIAKVNGIEESLKEAEKVHYEANQNHMDDRLENIKDTIKAGILVLAALLAWVIVILSSNPRGGSGSVDSGFVQRQIQAKNKQQQGNRADSDEYLERAEGKEGSKGGFWSK